ncbi:O-antigen chain length regulator [Pseudomonas sp. RtIB026]|uniref:Wzz/FepE/Etk N-terminal domain-containing protein n=1 Tax=Pseudomonas sp. RtIB026 TaxID=2749999 RepID=UPI00226D5E74|nr:Wzz/FepE/Etk N-terminal domain-containing protein [Pseudomonas sp. RtIB026]BDU09717.1 O-antigen chain length regulator [Pseudomonas sp. RtIB026]
MQNVRGGADFGDMDLFTLIAVLWEEKILVIGVALVVTLASIGYAFFASPLFEAKVYVQPPFAHDVARLNQGRGGDSGLKLISSKDAYTVFLDSLNSETLRRKFFLEFYMPNLSQGERSHSQDDLYARFNKLLVITESPVPERYSVVMRQTTPAVAANWLSRYVQMASEEAKAALIRGAQVEVSLKADSLGKKIEVARANARRGREDQVVQLSEALVIAETIGLEKPTEVLNTSVGETGGVRDMMYLRGSKALKAEIEALGKRESNDPFISGLRAYQEELAFYQALKVGEVEFEVYRPDGEVLEPDEQVKPNRALVISLGVLAGLLLGVAAALSQLVWRGVRRRGSSAAELSSS